MGSFNSQCFVSKQILSGEDKAFIIPFIENPKNTKSILIKDDNILNFHSVFEPTNTAFIAYSYPIECEYYDYGIFNIKNTEQNKNSLKYLFDLLFNDMLEVLAGDNPYHEKAFNIKKVYDNQKEYSFEDLLKIYKDIEENSIFNNQRSFVMKENKILNMNLSSISYYVLEYSKKSKHNFEQYCKKQLINQETIRNFLSFKNYIKDKEVNIFIDESLEKIVLDFLNSKQNIDYDELYRLVENRLNLYFILLIMKDMNIDFEPIVYAGQDYGNYTGKLFYKTFKEII